ncbi:MAG: nicotinate (nicotinamide) nucleotide adenylyltransferase [Flammeovirgaceae bacterium]|nr:nicotinate (nicotinamide) nucleotide adenylyltransferase [Flammeovirgaceae bacterium]MDW8287038.1 nicotinate (nicotinamide) nucleotide adenylyltransferase [Flammeovirgaceae bacterium]
MQIGLFFGSFNPIHIGHLIVANTIAESNEVGQVWFVVSPQNPFKKKHTLAHEFDRIHMVRLAIGDNPKFNVTDIEFRMPQPSYTIDTLTYLSEKYPQHQFSLIIGTDNLASLPKWKNYEQILNYYSILVYPRPDVELPASTLLTHPNVKIIEAPLLAISATYIRHCIQQNKSIRYLVPQEVADYIHAKKLYYF